MFSITTLHTSNASGKAQIRATGGGKQRTVALDHSKSEDYNRGAAVAALLNVLADGKQRAKLRHPSAKQRVRVKSLTDGGGKHLWTIDV